MKTINDIKLENPQYADVPDDELAYAIWEKSYSDKIGWGDFVQKIDLATEVKPFSSKCRLQ